MHALHLMKRTVAVATLVLLTVLATGLVEQLAPVRDVLVDEADRVSGLLDGATGGVADAVDDRLSSAVGTVADLPEVAGDWAGDLLDSGAASARNAVEGVPVVGRLLGVAEGAASGPGPQD